MQQRPLVASCYDHLSGILAERLTHCLIQLDWITPEPSPGITPLGWAGLAQMGIDLGPLTGGRRQPVTICREQYGPETFDHLGGHLGFLLQQHFIKSGWLQGHPDQFELTPAGKAALQRLGISLEDIT